MDFKNINKTIPVMVTGATGYVAGVLIKKLLEEGLTVHACIRDHHPEKKLNYLKEIAAKTKGKILFFKTDLLKEGSYKEAMRGCQVVFHTASPFKVHVLDPQKELIDPAVLGTKNVLEEANRCESVKRIVVTSSSAAIYGDNADLALTAKSIFTEENWNTTSSLKHNPYSYSKLLAEREAWKIYELQKRWELITINPTLVIGPGVDPDATSESYKLFHHFGDGTMKFGVPNIGLGVVDVRDLAIAHFKAAFLPMAKGRYLISAYNTTFPEIGNSLLEKFGKRYPIPRRTMPKGLVWLVAPLMNKALTRHYISKNVNYPWKGDNSKSIKELKMVYRPLKVSVEEFFAYLFENKE